MHILHTRMLFFITLSIFIHVIWFVGHQNYTIYIPQQADSRFSVQINQQNKNTTQTTVVTKTVINKTKAESKQAVHASQETSSSSDSDQSSALLLSQVKKQIKKHFVYPRMARRMGWQGEVLLSFSVDSIGLIHTVHIKKSSGYALLDDSAITALNSIGTINLKNIMSANSWQLEIPIIYRLEG